MSRIRLVFQIDKFFKRSKSGAIWGTIYFQDEQGHAFPDPGWTDLVEAFLITWMRALVNTGQETSVAERVRFYDGPMEIELKAGGMGFVDLTFLARDKPQFSIKEKMSDLLTEAVTMAEKLVEAVEERQWQNADTSAIVSLVPSCTNLIPRYKNSD